MAATGRLIFPNVAVRDLQKSMAFFKASGSTSTRSSPTTRRRA